MLIRQIFMGVLGISFGFIVSGGVFTVLISVGLIPRFAGKMHIAGHIFALEEMVVLGTIVGDFCSVFSDYGHIGEWVLARKPFGEHTGAVWYAAGSIVLIVFGVFSGIFVGCLALAIAEMLNTIPVFSRRIGFRHGLGIAILAVALGKLAGSLIYFTQSVYLHGGS
ncbi:MAG: stage V sporulation protein AB [Bacillus sp. (in: Bacteria)]|nr:stage V sporulation protein AB [Bacillus sp. (in: firmicutes)]MCM1426776.1 stage V sporulation protein AB [Eubacterium sp.]